MNPMESGLKVRPIVRADLATLKEVIASTGLFPPEMLDAMTASYFEGKEGLDHWLALVEDGPVAVAYFAPERMTSGTWNLYLIAVRSDRQGHGLGRTLIGHVEQLLTAEGARLLIVETSDLPEFERTRGFYERCGYDREATIRDFYQAGEDKVVFRKTLETG